MTEDPRAGLAAGFRGERRRAATIALAMLVGVNVLSQLDRQVMNVLVEDVRAEFGLGDAQLGGLVGLAFAMF